MRSAPSIDLPPQRVDVVTLAPHDLHPDTLVAREGHLLDAQERARHARFARPADQHIYLASHVMLRHALGAYLRVPPSALRFDKGSLGRPVLASSMQTETVGVEFNLSHTHGLCACAITRGARVGIDVEKIDESFHSLFDSAEVLAPAERLAMQQLPTDERARAFFRYWTLKEACTKAIGKGLLMAPNSVNFTLSDHGSSLNVELGGSPAVAWHVETRAVARDWMMALALETRGRVAEVVWHEWVPSWA